MRQGEHTRIKILKTANKLFYKKGFHRTTFSDIVRATGLSKGNITYHFRSKADILTAVFDQRIRHTKAVIESWNQKYPDARGRLLCFIDSLLQGKSELTRYGCPNGSLATELGKGNALGRRLSRSIFDLMKTWLKEQFMGLGFSSREAEARAMELFIRAQGTCVLSQVYNDEKFFEDEIKELKKLLEK